jgi:hypothetical protein
MEMRMIWILLGVKFQETCLRRILTRIAVQAKLDVMGKAHRGPRVQAVLLGDIEFLPKK